MISVLVAASLKIEASLVTTRMRVVEGVMRSSSMAIWRS
jgi:hypothetical protein